MSGQGWTGRGHLLVDYWPLSPGLFLLEPSAAAQNQALQCVQPALACPAPPWGPRAVFIWVFLRALSPCSISGDIFGRAAQFSSSSFFKLQMLKILPAFELPRGAPHLQPPCAVAMTTSPSL